jgi:hemoglobin
MRALLLIVLPIVLATCASKSPRSGTIGQPSGPVLYDRIGRMDAIKGIVKDFVEEQLLKGALSVRFTNVNAAQLEEHLSTQLCELSGGPCKYTGRSMRELHAGMSINEADFNAFVAGFEQSLIKFKVDATEQRELLALLRKYKDEIVQ